MQWWQAALWGIAGGFLIEALELYASIHRSKRRWNWRRPIPQGMAAFWVSAFIRLGAGGTVSSAMAKDGQVTGAVAAFGLGVAAPLVVQKLARLVPLTVDVPDLVEPSPGQAPTVGGKGHLGQMGPAEQPVTGGGGNAP